MKNVIKNAFLKSLPVMAGYIVLGIGFGNCGGTFACVEEKYTA